jgi:hypothetical protein
VGQSVRARSVAGCRGYAIAHGGPNQYETGLRIQEEGRKQFLEPLLNGPLGQIAKQPKTARVIAALFPTGGNLLPGMEGEVRNAVFALARERPAVAEQLVRAHIKSVFNQAATDLQGGANQFAGAKFAVKLVGNPQSLKNMQAAIEALPHGNARWESAQKLLDIVSATGARRPLGSLTSFNDLDVKSMSGSGLAAIVAKGASPAKWWSAANDAYKSWSSGNNLGQLVNIITNPRAGNFLKNVARLPSGSDRAAIIAGGIILKLGASTTEQRSKPN